MAGKDPSRLLGKKIRGHALLQVIGSGEFGTVYKAKKNDCWFAVKCVDFRQKRKEAKAELLYANENLRHENLVEVSNFYFKPETDAVYMIMEYCAGGDLNSHVLTQNPTTELVIENMEDVSRGLSFLHSSQIIHRNLKPSNVLVSLANTGRPICKIGDFGFSKFQGTERCFQTVLGSPDFRAPEISTEQKYTYSADVYSLGLLFFVMHTKITTDGKCLAPYAENKGHKRSIQDLIQKDKMWKECICAHFEGLSEIGTLVCSMIEPRPEKRIMLGDIIATVAFVKGKFAASTEKAEEMTGASGSGNGEEIFVRSIHFDEEAFRGIPEGHSGKETKH